MSFVMLLILSFPADKRRVYDRYGKEGLKSGGMGGGGKSSSDYSFTVH